MSLNFSNFQYILDTAMSRVSTMNILYTVVICTTLPLTTITGWLIIYRTPERMGNYRFMMLAQLIIAIIFMILVYLLQPIPLFPYSITIATGPLHAIGRRAQVLLSALTLTTAVNMGLSTLSSVAYLIVSFSKTTQSRGVFYWAAMSPTRGKISLLITHTVPSVTIFLVVIACGNEEDQIILSEILKETIHDFDFYRLEYTIWGMNPDSVYFYILVGFFITQMSFTLIAKAYFMHRTDIELKKLQAMLSPATHQHIPKFALLVKFYFFVPLLLIGLPIAWGTIAALALPDLAYRFPINAFFLFPIFCFTLVFCVSHLTLIAPYRQCIVGLFRKQKAPLAVTCMVRHTGIISNRSA